MKSANQAFSTEHNGHNPPNSEEHKSSSRGHYVLVAILFAVAFLLARWVASAPSVLISSQTWSGFVVFWLGGGLVTLFLLTLAAKRKRHLPAG